MLATDTSRRWPPSSTTREKRTSGAPFLGASSGMTIVDGYAIQSDWVRLGQAEGRTVRGRKIGLTSRAMQHARQITEPDYAPLMDDMFFEAGGDIPVDRFIAPRVEVELAFILGRPLAGRRDAGRRARGDRTGDAGGRDHRRPHRAVRSRDEGAAQGLRHDLGLCGQRRHRGRRPTREAGCGRPAMGRGLALQERRHRGDGAGGRRPQPSRHGRGLVGQQDRAARRAARRRGHRPSGSFTRPTTAQAGDNFHVDYGPLGTVAFRFV